MVQVTHFQRMPGGGAFSIERLFKCVRSNLPSDIQCTVHVSPYVSCAVLPRVRSVLAARRHQGAVNHITGDVHFLALGLRPERTILTVHDCGNLMRLHGLRRTVLRWLWFTWPIARCRIVTVVSEATKADLIRLAGTPPYKIRVVYSCVAPEFTPQPAVFNATRPTILMLGAAPNKNLERMASALAGLRCAIELIGCPTPDQAAVFAAHGLDLRILGHVDDASVLAAYHRCDLLLFASTLEGFGMPIVEAQAVGRPVVTSNCSSMPEVARDSACLVNPFDPAAIRAGVERVIGDAGYREELVCRGFANARRFSAAKIASDYAAIYREIVQANCED